MPCKNKYANFTFYVNHEGDVRISTKTGNGYDTDEFGRYNICHFVFSANYAASRVSLGDWTEITLAEGLKRLHLNAV